MFLLFSALSCHGRVLKTKRPMTDHLLREDCGYELLYTKQLNQEQYEGPVGRRGWRGLVQARWSWLQWSWLYVAYLLSGS